MAPLSLSDDLSISSLELDSQSSPQVIDLPRYLESLTLAEREALNQPLQGSPTTLLKRSSDLSPFEAHNLLTARNAPRSTQTGNPASGGVPPDHVNMKAVQAAFAIIGAAFVIASIWFFFWAKNGGFRFRRGDWDDYKSTVLRRKGPDGKTLSNATKSTKLGGGSVVGRGYRDYEDDETSMGMTEVTKTVSTNTGITGVTGVTGGAGARIKRMRERMADKKARKVASKNLKKHVRETEKQAKNRAEREAGWEGAADPDVRAYRHEKVARVGGLNKDADGQGTFYGGSTDYSETETSYSGPSQYAQVPNEPSERYPNPRRSRQHSPEKPTISPVRPSREYRASPSHHESSSRRASRQSSPVKGPRRERASMPGGYVEALDMSEDYSSRGGENESDLGTRSYHHPIPGLSASGGRGYRRGRRDSLDDSE